MSSIRLSCRLAAAAALAALAACAQPPQVQALAVTGSATYRERMALPDQAVFEATVEDVARADAASITVGRVRIVAPQVPVRFSIPVDPAQLTPGGRYVVRARIEADGRLLFTSVMVHAVLGADGVRHADLLLRRVAAAPVATAIRRMSGQYSLLADAAVFTDCASGVRMAVAEEGDNPTLQRAYLASRPQPGASLLATVDGRVESRPPAEDGGAARPVLVVERYVAVLAGPCGTPHSTAELQETYWRLVELKGRAVVVADRRREPHVELHPDGRVTGSTGCNRLAGSYTSDAERISFGRTAGTMMACAAGADDERGFLDALGAAARWRIDGERLELLDAQGGSLARFESVYLR